MKLSQLTGSSRSTPFHAVPCRSMLDCYDWIGVIPNALRHVHSSRERILHNVSYKIRMSGMLGPMLLFVLHTEGITFPENEFSSFFRVTVPLSYTKRERNH